MGSTLLLVELDELSSGVPSFLKSDNGILLRIAILYLVTWVSHVVVHCSWTSLATAGRASGRDHVTKTHVPPSCTAFLTARTLTSVNPTHFLGFGKKYQHFWSLSGCRGHSISLFCFISLFTVKVITNTMTSV